MERLSGPGGIREKLHCELRNLTRAEWKMQILGSDHLALVLGIDNEYDTAAEDEKYNLEYWSSLAYDF